MFLSTLRRRQWLQLGAAASLAPWGAAHAQARPGRMPDGAPLVVAQIADMSPGQQDVSRDFVVGARAAWQEINARGGIRGRAVEHRTIEVQGTGAGLQAAWRSAVMPELMASLPIAGVDGTLKKHWREDDLRGQAHLKTGSLDDARAVAGYLLDKNGHRWIVVALVNHPEAGTARPALEALLHWVWAGRR